MVERRRAQDQSWTKTNLRNPQHRRHLLLHGQRLLHAAHQVVGFSRLDPLVQTALLLQQVVERENLVAQVALQLVGLEERGVLALQGRPHIRRQSRINLAAQPRRTWSGQNAQKREEKREEKRREEGCSGLAKSIENARQRGKEKKIVTCASRVSTATVSACDMLRSMQRSIRRTVCCTSSLKESSLLGSQELMVAAAS
eukprot:scaffold716_cov364-Pinguiococcus_pyrenoidosus.AAC.12